MESLLAEAKSSLLKRVTSIKLLLVNIGLIATGCIVFSIGMNSVMIPHHLYGGGLTGIAILVKYHIPFLNIGLMYFLLNIPLLALGWYSISRGVTFLEGEGAYFHQKKKVILTITNLTDLPKMKALVLKCDPRAFVVVNDTVEVLGARYGAPRSY